MNRKNKKTMNRFWLSLAQHLAMAVALLIMVVVFQASIIRMEGGSSDRYYRVDPFDNSSVTFEESPVFRQMFYDAVSDLTTLVVLRNQFEIDGAYDGGKVINVTDFVNRQDQVSDAKVTATYYLESLVRWGREGVVTEKKVYGKKEFINAFQDNLLDISHYYLEEESGALQYSGDPIKNRREMIRSALMQISDVSQLTEEEWNRYYQEQMDIFQETFENYRQYNEDMLVELAFQYVIANMDKPVSLINEDGEEKVEVEMLRQDYPPIENGDLQQIAGNWFDYCKLENNVLETLEIIKRNYEIYESRMAEYAADRNNVQYFFRIQDESGSKSFTNLSDGYTILESDEIDYYFQNMGRYLIYFVESNICETNVDVTDEDIYRMVETHEYAFPPGSVIWVGVPDDYQVEGDLFAIGKEVFNTIIRHVWAYTVMVGLLLLAWLVIAVYLTVTSSREETVEGNGEGTAEAGLVWFDRLYTEFVILLAVVLFYLGREGFRRILTVEGDDFGQTVAFLDLLPDSLKWLIYVMGFGYGFLISLFLCIFWYSLVRRIKAGNLLRDSLLHFIWKKLRKAGSMILYHKSIAVRTLIPYNFFLMVNLAAFAVIVNLRRNGWILLMALIGALVFDAVIGVILFRKNAEMREIVETIERIRQGDVDCRLDPERMHGENQQIAEAVNNINEGIQNAVATSVKDERLKSDLITNVSHDIKTPLTSIINYVDLLKREKIEQEPAKSYIEILEGKTQRLKQLTDDLVEASKISSGNIILQRERLNLTELVNQAIGEFTDKFEQQSLQPVFEDSKIVACIYADSRRMWRVVENLFNNVCKYAMAGTRVYIDLKKENGLVELSVKNISRQQLNIRAEDLMERFIRGDESRTTEGSGLGLSITKNLTELQDGSFNIFLDGDLFKVVLQFPEMTEEIKPEPEKVEEK